MIQRKLTTIILLISGLLIFQAFTQQTAAQAASSISIDTQMVVRTTYPQVFGITNTPDPGWLDAWNKVKNVGVTMVRKDYNIENLVPVTTIDNYKANINSIQSIANWNQSALGYRAGIYNTAKTAGIQTLGIIDYTPAWLTYGNVAKGVPRDWDVWEDLVKKSHSYFMDDLDAVEIWNEPNYSKFLVIDGSPYATSAAAYIDLFKHTYAAVRAVDSSIPIGGPSGFNWSDTGFLRSILADQFVREHLDFITVHSYAHPTTFQYDVTAPTRSVLAEYGLTIPISVSEWNYIAGGVVDDRHTEPAGISFIGKSILDFWRHGIISAHYYVGRPYTAPGEMAFYKWENQIATLLPPTRALQVVSNSLKMGKGEGELLSSTVSGESIDGVGLINSDGNPAIFLVNDTSFDQVADITVTGLAEHQNYQLQYFAGSAANTGETPYKEESKTTTDGTLQLTATLPPTSVLGILSQESFSAACDADIDQNGLVDLSDHSLLVNLFLKSTSQGQRADITGDGFVDLSDYSEITMHFLNACGNS